VSTIPVPSSIDPAAWAALDRRLVGDCLRDDATRSAYATDASEYQERPLAVVTPQADADVFAVVRFAAEHQVGVIARGAGTSLAGQVVGGGIVLDFSRHMNRILAIDSVERRVWVQPGVVRNELNHALAAHGLFFAPETSTANRATIGGMVGNNSCGANSIVYGSTRDHLLRARVCLADGTEAMFQPQDSADFAAACAGADGMATGLHRTIRALLAPAENRALIREHYPKSTVTRRNTGYALDRLMDTVVFDPDASGPFNFCQVLAGSEGTLAIGLEYQLNCEPIPPPAALLCAHFATVQEALHATLIAMRHQPSACELIDRTVLECTRGNLAQSRNRFFIEGDPGAILVVEVRDASPAAGLARLAAVADECRASGLGTAFPLVTGADVDRVWELRRAGQGLLANVPGDAKPREIVEDTAVAVVDLPAYIAEFDELLTSRYGVSCVHYAHAGAGELHTRPLFNLRSEEGLRNFRAIATDVAALVKRYRGSLSGEHGDGRLRGEFIPFMVGPECYAMMRRLKQAADPMGILNPGKIIDTPPMDTSLRVGPQDAEPRYLTVLDFSASGGILRAAEQCNGVGECRKSHRAGGTMCPSYMATRDERDTTRARATVLRQALARSAGSAEPWTSADVAAVMQLCLSCKACKSECPSNVDMARLKAEWQQQRYDRLGVPWRTRAVAGAATGLRIAARWPAAYNLATRLPALAGVLKRGLRFAPGRSLPPLGATTLRRWHRRHANPSSGRYPHGAVHLFADEFTDTLDAAVGIAAVQLLNRLGYEVRIPSQVDSGRAHLSTGLVRAAERLAAENVRRLDPVVTDDAPLIGIEPSALLGFRDEYPDLVPGPASRRLATRALLIDEFIAREAAAGRIGSEHFTARERRVLVHGHCHQKALASMTPTLTMLTLPRGYRVELIPSGCCGMAGAFGYQADHFAVSMQIGELTLLPAVRAADPDTVIAAAGTSCRHQIHDGAARTALHPVTILHQALE
jgi:FAD/FMN-containing dehydrogenase/Fe-S oxidoreductase